MTCIVSSTLYKTKKALRTAVADDPALVLISDPSIFSPRHFSVSDMLPGQSEVVTNHPKRSWFAVVKCEERGVYHVK